MKNLEAVEKAGTESGNSNISTEEIVSFLKQLEKDFGVVLEVTNATGDMVDVSIDKMPNGVEDTVNFVGELYEFAPDTYTNGFRGYSHHILKNKKFSLWWD